MRKKSKCECIYVFFLIKKETFCIPATYINLYIKVSTMRNKVILNFKKVGRRHSLWLSVLSSTCMLAKSHSTLCNPMNCGPPGSSVHTLLQARTLEWWAAMPSSRGSSQLRDRTLVSYVSCIGRRAVYH